MSSNGDCYIVLPTQCAEKTIIFGRNSIDGAAVNDAQEIIYYNANEAILGKCDGGAEPTFNEPYLRIILQKPIPGVWGGDCGANEQSVAIGISWSQNEPENGSGHIRASDIVRFVLATATTADAAVNEIGKLIQVHGSDEAKFNFIVCDTTEAWLVSCGGKLMAAKRLTSGQHRIPSDNLSVTVAYDKSTENLSETLQTLGYWNGTDELNFAACFNAASNLPTEDCCGPEGDGTYTLTDMFKRLRDNSSLETSRSAAVFVLNGNGISSYWFTGTPYAMESVFKPFVFAPNSKISPLTKVPTDSAVTLLHKLHAQRKLAALEHLKTLESTCVSEVSKYLEEHPVADEELDELMKDCVEAEVKFYR